MRLIQLQHPELGRRVAMVEEPQLILIAEQFRSCYALFEEIIEQNHPAIPFISGLVTDQKLEYDLVYDGSTEWRILPSFDHPDNPLACMLSGTGLTHKASAENRQKMHEQMTQENELMDSMEIYLWGEEGGKPGNGKIGVQPEWFFKGNGSALKGFNDPLEVPPYANDGGEEPEIAGIYYIDKADQPCRIGFTIANEFSDHVMEKKNYLYLAPSKLRSPSIGPELVLDSDFQDITGTVSVERNNRKIWTKKIKSGEQNMAHSLQNLEYHHFKYKQHCIPGMVHVHFLGADAFSFGDDVRLKDGDWMEVSFEGFGRPLRNPVRIDPEKEKLV
ncbi:MAG: AraD1 family protein, partial [Balneolaceae bacterium]|nr:AraD1 family protein [Balneolaceae bacterium]